MNTIHETMNAAYERQVRDAVKGGKLPPPLWRQTWSFDPSKMMTLPRLSWSLRLSVLRHRLVAWWRRPSRAVLEGKLRRREVRLQGLEGRLDAANAALGEALQRETALMMEVVIARREGSFYRIMELMAREQHGETIKERDSLIRELWLERRRRDDDRADAVRHYTNLSKATELLRTRLEHSEEALRAEKEARLDAIGGQ